jgi:hypothetical protein
MRPDHYEIIVECDQRPRVLSEFSGSVIVRVRSIVGMRVGIGGVRFWGRWRSCTEVFFPHRPELPANPMERRR